MIESDFTLKVVSNSEVTFDAVATEFAKMNSEKQAIFLSELFDALKHECKNHYNFESQLWHIAAEIRSFKFNELLYVVETLNDFTINALKKEKND